MAVGGVASKLGSYGACDASDAQLRSIAGHGAAGGRAGLRQGEVDLALVGGVNAVLLARADQGDGGSWGCCRGGVGAATFDASADGFVRSEGCGMVVLKRLAEAETAGDRIWAVIRGAAVNQNGTSAGPTVPNGPAQERVIEEALSQAGLPAVGTWSTWRRTGQDRRWATRSRCGRRRRSYGRGRDARTGRC